MKEYSLGLANSFTNVEHLSGATPYVPYITPEPFYSLTASRDADKVKAAIVRKYGENWYNEQRYFDDLVEFVHALCDGQ